MVSGREKIIKIIKSALLKVHKVITVETAMPISGKIKAYQIFRYLEQS